MKDRRNTREISTSTGPLVVIAEIAEKLLREGVISGSLDSVLHAADPAIVKAAVMAASKCDFCNVPGASHETLVIEPSGVTIDGDSTSEGYIAWLSCDVCYGFVQDDKREKLVDRAMESVAFPKFSRRSVAELFDRFWRGMDEKAQAAGLAAAVADFVEDRLPTPVMETDRAKRIGIVANATRGELTREQVDRIANGKLDPAALRRLVKWYGERVDARGGDPQRLISTLGAPAPPLPSIVPHWQTALDEKFNAMEEIDRVLKSQSRTMFSPENTDSKDPAAVRRAIEQAKSRATIEDLDFATDLKQLRVSEAYSFGKDPIDAIMEAAKLLPPNSPLSSVTVPTGCGWFWFSQALPIATSPISSDSTDALLWGWDTIDVGEGAGPEVAMRFSGYVRGVHGEWKGRLVPSARWYWPLSSSFADMLTMTRRHYNEQYRVGGKFHGSYWTMGEDATVDAVAQLSSFFISACLWFGQKILVPSVGHVERHARKRYEREHKLTTAPSVRVIALRASERKASEHTPSGVDGHGRRLKVRFVVDGHPRLQRVGPGRKDVKLIWIDRFVKGPDGAPFQSRRKVFAVIR